MAAAGLSAKEVWQPSISDTVAARKQMRSAVVSVVLHLQVYRQSSVYTDSSDLFDP